MREPGKATTGVAAGSRRWGLAWLGTTFALLLHVVDEASHDFLSFYNPAVLSVRAKLPWFPLPTFELWGWLTVVGGALLVLLLLAPWVGPRWIRGTSTST